MTRFPQPRRHGPRRRPVPMLLSALVAAALLSGCLPGGRDDGEEAGETGAMPVPPPPEIAVPPDAEDAETSTGARRVAASGRRFLRQSLDRELAESRSTLEKEVAAFRALLLPAPPSP